MPEERLGGVKNVLRRIRRSVNQALGNDLPWPTVPCPTALHLGTDYGGWCVIPGILPPRPCVFSIGVGQDISFDLEMIRRFDATVYGFDPTPRSVRWISTQQVPPSFHFVPIGLGNFDGMADFGLPRDDWDVYSTTLPLDKSVERVQCRVARLATLAAEVKTAQIDVLKIDIEGGEYAALPDTLNSGFIFPQLLLELHYVNGRKAELTQARDLLQLVHDKGYRLFRRSPVGREFSFVHQSKLS